MSTAVGPVAIASESPLTDSLSPRDFLGIIGVVSVIGVLAVAVGNWLSGGLELSSHLWSHPFAIQPVNQSEREIFDGILHPGNAPHLVAQGAPWILGPNWGYLGLRAYLIGVVLLFGLLITAAVVEVAQHCAQVRPGRTLLLSSMLSGLAVATGNWYSNGRELSTRLWSNIFSTAPTTRTQRGIAEWASSDQPPPKRMPAIFGPTLGDIGLRFFVLAVVFLFLALAVEAIPDHVTVHANEMVEGRVPTGTLTALTEKTTFLAVALAGHRREQLRDEWLAHLAGGDRGPLPGVRRVSLVLGFLFAALRFPSLTVSTETPGMSG